MDPQYAHAFIVKLWLERREIEGTKPEWRGRIDHVQSGRRVYFRDIVGITHFIQAFLENTESLLPGDEENDTGTRP
jgi:predicted AAA+ superfamily ATPase